MKANEAPEKLYVDATDNPKDVWVRAFRQPFMECGVEYIRTDVFCTIHNDKNAKN